MKDVETGLVNVVSVTRMGDAFCVGGFDWTHRRSVRLGRSVSDSSRWPFLSWWNVTYKLDPSAEAPHVEDVIIVNRSLETPPPGVTMPHIAGQALRWKGDSNALFDGLLRWTASASGYVSRKGELPTGSVGFWRPAIDLRFDEGRYVEDSSGHRLAYVGVQEPDKLVPANSLVRVSLARWWTHDPTFEERCYLQLSCWYPGL